MAEKLILLNINCGPKYCGEECQGLHEMDTCCGVFLQMLEREHGRSRRCSSCLAAEAGDDCLTCFLQSKGHITNIPAKELQRIVESLDRELAQEKCACSKLREELQKERQRHKDAPGKGKYCPNQCKYASSLRKSGFCRKYRQYRMEVRDKWRKRKWVRLVVCQADTGGK